MKKLITLMILVTALITSACGNDSATSNSALKVMLESNVVSLDTSQATDVASFEVIADCIDGLLQSDAAGKPIPAIAESFEVSDDGLTYTFHLRDAKWSNGDPVTAGDFVFAWRRHCQQAQEYAYMMGSTVACVKNADAVIKGADPATLGVSAPDDKTFIVQLDTPVTFFPSLMCFPTFYPINEKFYNSLNPGTYGTTPDTFLSNGAFVLTDYLPGAATIQLNKNDNYWNASSINLSGLQYQVVTSSDNALTAFKTGTLDIVQISGNQVTHVKEDPNLVKSLQIMPAGSLTYLSFNEDPKNHHAGALANADLRLAVSNAIDRESLVNNYVITGAKALYTVIPLDFAANINTGEYFSADQSRYTELVGYNVSKARQHLQAAIPSPCR